MSGRFFIGTLFLFCVVFSTGDTAASYAFPICNVPKEEIVNINIGENASFKVVLHEDNDGKHWNANFTWINERDQEICGSSNGICKGERKVNFAVDVRKMAFSGKNGSSHSYYIHVAIFQPHNDDNGIYFLQSSYKSPCKILKVYIIVRDPPVCSALISREYGHIESSCRWLPRVSNDKMELMVGNRTLQLYQMYENHNNFSNRGTAKLFWGSTIVLSATIISIEDEFDESGILDTCLVSNAQLGYKNRCHFPVVMSPKINEISEYGEKVSFTCCTNSMDNESVPSLWYYINRRTLKLTEQIFAIDLDTSTHGSRDGKNSVVFICGEGNDDELTSFRMGKLVLNLEYIKGVSLSGRIGPREPTSKVPNSEETCTHTYIITVAANFLETAYQMDISVSNTGSSSSHYQRETLPTSISITNPDLYSSRHSKMSGVFLSLESYTSIVVVIAISLLINIVQCVSKCYKFIVFNNISPEKRNTHPDSRSRTRIKEETIEMSSMSSELPRSAEHGSCTLHAHDAGIDNASQQNIASSRSYKRRLNLLEEWQRECTLPKIPVCCEQFACNQTNSLGRNESPSEEKSALDVYQTISEDTSSVRIYQTLEEDKFPSSIYQTLGEDKSPPGIYQTLGKDKLSIVVLDNLGEELSDFDNTEDIPSLVYNASHVEDHRYPFGKCSPSMKDVCPNSHIQEEVATL